MSDTLNKKEVDQLLDLFNKIKLDLQDSSFPTRTNRLEAVENMKKVLKIHGYSVCLLYTSPSPRDLSTSRMPSSA